MSDKLKDKQKLFIKEFFVDFNATQAAIRAGYSSKTASQTASRLLSNVKVQNYISQEKDKLFTKLDISQEKVLNEIARVAFFDIRQIAKWSDSYISFKDSNELDDDSAAAISEITSTTFEDTTTVKVKTYDKMNALEKLAKYLDLYKNDTSNNNVIQIYHADEQDIALSGENNDTKK